MQPDFFVVNHPDSSLKITNHTLKMRSVAKRRFTTPVTGWVSHSGGADRKTQVRSKTLHAAGLNAPRGAGSGLLYCRTSSGSSDCFSPFQDPQRKGTESKEEKHVGV